MPFRKFKDNQKQFLGIGIWCKNNEDGSHSEKNVLRVLARLRSHSKLDNGSSVCNSKVDNYISTSVNCYEDEIAEMAVIIRKLPGVLKIKVQKHMSSIELLEYAKDLLKKQ
jgi:hypothetical protein